MGNPTVRLSPQSYLTLKELAANSGETLQVILDRAVEEERKRRFFELANLSYARLQEDAQSWLEFEQDLSGWETTLGDGLHNEPSL
jgi:predicted transcriptional regulator